LEVVKYCREVKEVVRELQLLRRQVVMVGQVVVEDML
jgi:hypothetical protein